MTSLVSAQARLINLLRLRGACLALPRISFPRLVSFHSCLRPLPVCFLLCLHPIHSRHVWFLSSAHHFHLDSSPPISNPHPHLDRRATPITNATIMAAPPTRQWGVTPPISTALPTQDELVANDNLIAELKAQNNFEPPSETERRWVINQPTKRRVVLLIVSLQKTNAAVAATGSG